MATTAFRAIARQAVHWHRPLLIFAAVNALLAVVALIGMAADDRLIAGSPAWFKPFKFAMSFVLYCPAWAWLISLHPRGSRLLWWTGTTVVTAGAIEQAIIVAQVLRGARSHFNTTTTVDTALWTVMTVTIIVLFLGTLALGAALAFQQLGDAANSWAIRIGILISLVGMALGQLMPGRESGVDGIAGAHTVGAADGTPGLPLTGWSTTHGDLRIPHFVGMHALQLLPLFAAALTLSAARLPVLRRARVRLGLVWTAGIGYAGLLTLLTWQALRGQSLVRPDGATTAAFGVLVAMVPLGVLLSVTSARIPRPPAVAR
ncbi:hypothetical protein [Nocardia sp. NPDC050710]|uniref:hypothetical protein n=1 Tax=Nocardia sp. NPDC050710 TaxID=3157220 RepID=UPI0033CED04D